ncbi:MAG: uracil-DNA glycosylase family protein [Chthoniobacterales bacterium]
MARAQNISEQMVAAAERLREEAGRLRFGSPVTHVYNPLEYAWRAHEDYLRRYATRPKRALFLGMNPGPFGMAQTGVPFGEIAAVRDWLGIQAPIGKPRAQHPKRLITGFACLRTEISGQRLWRLFRERFGTPEKFFAEYFVVNYCPLVFMEESGGNRTPDKLRPAGKTALFRICDRHLREVIALLQPEWLIGIGDFAMKRAQAALPNDSLKIARVLHPSPASPAANRNWAGLVAAELERLGVWPPTSAS